MYDFAHPRARGDHDGSVPYAAAPPARGRGDRTATARTHGCTHRSWRTTSQAPLTTASRRAISGPAGDQAMEAGAYEDAVVSTARLGRTRSRTGRVGPLRSALRLGDAQAKTATTTEGHVLGRGERPQTRGPGRRRWRRSASASRRSNPGSSPATAFLLQEADGLDWRRTRCGSAARPALARADVLGRAEAREAQPRGGRDRPRLASRDRWSRSGR
jgi:hypothetical protein